MLVAGCWLKAEGFSRSRVGQGGGAAAPTYPKRFRELTYYDEYLELRSFVNRKISLFCFYSAFLVFLWPADNLWGTDWKFYSANEHFFCFYDPGRIVRPNPETVQVWLNWLATPAGRKQRILEMEQRKIPKSAYEKYETTRVLMELNCREKKYLVLSVADLDENGRTISSGSKTCFPREVFQPFPIAKDTSEEDLSAVLCAP